MVRFGKKMINKILEGEGMVVVEERLPDPGSWLSVGGILPRPGNLAISPSPSRSCFGMPAHIRIYMEICGIVRRQTQFLNFDQGSFFRLGR
jgi:hypothetical protein